MKIVQRFTSFEDLKSAERRMVPESPATVLKRHRAFERLMADIREHMLRKGECLQR
jgi:hypothetical protein